MYVLPPTPPSCKFENGDPKAETHKDKHKAVHTAVRVELLKSNDLLIPFTAYE
jgi:hypothetical protein